MYGRRIRRFINDHVATTLVLLFLIGGLAIANLTSHVESTLDDLILALDSDADGAISDEAWYTAFVTTTEIGTSYDTSAELDALFAAKEDQLTNEAGLYAVLSDVTDFVQTSEIDTAAELESVANLGTYFNTLAGATSAVNLLTLTGVTATATEVNILDGVTGVTYDEIDYLDGLSENIITSLNARCLESVFGTSLNADDLVLDTGVLKTAAEIPHTDVAETLTASWEQIDLRLDPLASVPSLNTQRIFLADGTNWDPAGLDGSVAYWTLYDGANWIALWDEDGTWFISSIEVPSYGAFANADALYSDYEGGTPYGLIEKECKNTILTNVNEGGSSEYDLPAASFGMNFMFTVIAAQNVVIDPDGTEQLWLNGVQMAAGEPIVNEAPTKGDSISCWSIETSNGVYEIFCSSANADWEEDTPP